MAKRGTPGNPKTLMLAERLGIQPWAALGLLEALWHWTGRYCPTGDITDNLRGLGSGLRHRGNPKKLIDALVAERWIDVHDSRYYIHHWPDHADDAVRKFLNRAGRSFADYYPPAARQRREIDGHGLDTGASESRLPLPKPLPRPEPEPYERLLAAYPSPTKTDLGQQVWISLEDTGVIHPENLAEIFEGLERWKQSELWAEGKIHAVSTWLQGRLWKDYPKPAEQSGQQPQTRMEKMLS